MVGGVHAPYHPLNNMWLRLTTVKRIEKAGRVEVYQPGDWIQVGEHVGRYLAMQWIADGSAEAVGHKPTELTALTSDTGIVILTNAPHAQKQVAELFENKVAVTVGSLSTPYRKTLLWHPSVRLRAEVVHWGMMRLDNWQVVVPLWRYDTLASEIGSEADRARTQAITHDLRIMVYQPGLVFLRVCPETRQLIEFWKEELIDADEPKLAFLRAIYRARPILCSCPPGWGGEINAKRTR